MGAESGELRNTSIAILSIYLLLYRVIINRHEYHDIEPLYPPAMWRALIISVWRDFWSTSP